MTSIVAAVAVAVGAVAQFATGFGFSLVCGPFLVAAYRAPTGVQLNILLSLFVNVALLAREHRRVDLRAAVLLLAPAVIVVVPVGGLLRRLPTGPLTVLAGLVCLGAVVALVRGRELRRLAGRSGTVVVGALSGAMNAVAGMSGPPAVVYAVNAGWPIDRIRPTLQLYFLGLNVVTLAAVGWPRELPIGLLAAFAAGIVGGGVLAGRLSGPALRPAMLALAGAGSVLAVARGVTG